MKADRPAWGWRARVALASLAICAGCRHLSVEGEKGGLVAVSASEEVQQAFTPRRFALVIGISEVLDGEWRALRFATKDAQDLARALREPTLGRFDEVTVATSRAATTRAGLLQAAAALAARATRPDDIVVLYVSAHGTLARDRRGTLRRYLVTSDAQYRRVAETALAVDELEAAFDQAASKRKVVVLATCHSGSGKSLLPTDVAAELATLKSPGFVRPLEEASRATLVLSASDWGEAAREDETLQNDVYTHFLIEGLRGGADRNGDGAVTATEAHDFARRRTWVFSSGRQRPSAELVEVGADPIVLSGAIRQAGQPELFSYAPRLDGFAVVVDGEPRGELPGGVALRPGPHRLELTKGGAVLLSEELSLGIGERVDLERLVLRGEPSRSVSLTGGAFGFLDERSRAEVLPAAPSVGASLRFDRVLLDRLAVELDLSGFSGRQAVVLGGPPVPFTYTSLLGGAALLYAWEWRQLVAWAGPRVAGLWVQRSFSLEAYRGRQAAFSVTPGVMAGAGWRVGRLEVTVNLQLMMTVLTVDGQARALGFAGGWAAVGYRF